MIQFSKPTLKAKICDMRPVIKIQWQKDPLTNRAKLLGRGKKSYRKALRCFLPTWGAYCVFCEMRIHAGPTVEHLKAEEAYPNLINYPENLLLSCRYCNSRKGTNSISIRQTYLPHLHNLMTVVDYEYPDYIPSTKHAKAQSLLNAYKLSLVETQEGYPDVRHTSRMEATYYAIEALQDYLNGELTLSFLTKSASMAGHFSIWYTLFQDYPEVLNALRTAFPGTADCFDNEGLPIPRNYPRTDPT